MSTTLYKYVGPAHLEHVFSGDGAVSLRCSYPKDFNDPYELFLAISFMERPELLAFYEDLIGAIPQLPTTCFSRSPSVTPMWAHYAKELQGFVLALNEEKIAAHFPKSSFGNVDYRNKPDESISDALHRAFAIGKFRYLYLLQKAVFGAAYFTKSKFWSYELERRMVVGTSEARTLGDLLLIDIPNECIDAIIAGPRSSLEIANSLRAHAERIGCGYFQMHIGRSTTTPYFVGNDGTPFVCKSGMLKASTGFCLTCREPIPRRARQCSWCQIRESHQRMAAERNTFRMLADRGLLEEYIRGMEEITHGKRN